VASVFWSCGRGGFHSGWLGIGGVGAGGLASAAVDAERNKWACLAKHAGECGNITQASSESSSLDIADETPFFGRLGNYTEGGEIPMFDIFNKRRNLTVHDVGQLIQRFLSDSLRYPQEWNDFAASFQLVRTLATGGVDGFEVIRVYVRDLRNQAAKFEVEPEIRTS
jgi:hypothetical protein